MKKEHNNYNGGNTGRPHQEGQERGGAGSERGGSERGVSSGVRQGHQDSRQAGHQESGSDKCPTCKNARNKGQDVR